MAVKIEKGGWILIFLIGVALVGYSLNRYGVIDLSKWIGRQERVRQRRDGRCHQAFVAPSIFNEQ